MKWSLQAGKVELKWRIKSVPQLWFWIQPEVLAMFCFPGCFHVCQWTCHTTQAEQAEKCSYFSLCAVAPAETCLGVCVCVQVCVCVCLSVCGFKRALTHIRLVSSVTSNLSERRRCSYEYLRYEPGKLHTQHVSEVLFSANYNSPARPKQKVAGYCHYDERTFFFFFGHPSSQKYNQLLNWGVFSSKVFHNKWLWHKECQRWTPSHNRFPAQAPVMALCVTASSPAGPAKWAKQAVNQPASDSTRNQTRRSVSQLLRVSYSLRRPRPFSAQCDEKGGRALQPGP